jgi:hypothetical protein
LCIWAKKKKEGERMGKKEYKKNLYFFNSKENLYSFIPFTFKNKNKKMKKQNSCAVREKKLKFKMNIY